MHWYVGTSGWGYDAWEGAFYPLDMKATDRLAYYARYFDAVEINNSFYHLPKREQITHWQQAVPEDFTFAVKASRYITHRKKLKDAERALPELMAPISRQSKIGAVIFQLPPHWRKNTERLASFLKLLPASRRFAMEFRDSSWHDDDVYELLKKHNVAFCLFEKGELRSPRIATADFIYVRLHGRKEGYKGRYNRATLAAWHDWLAGQPEARYLYFFR